MRTFTELMIEADDALNLLHLASIWEDIKAIGVSDSHLDVALDRLIERANEIGIEGSLSLYAALNECLVR